MVEATTHKAVRAATTALSAAGNSVGARNVLEIDDLRTMNSPTTGQGSAAKWLLLLFVRFYQAFLSPFLGGACKFYPSCSRYAQEAIALHGARRGAWLAMKRLGRCRPLTKGGFDPVPEVVDEPAGAESYGTRGTSAANAAAPVGETYVVAKATTHKADRGVRPGGIAAGRDAEGMLIAGTSAAKAASGGEGYVLAKATTHKAATQGPAMHEATNHKANVSGWSEYRDAEWLRTTGKERAQ